MMRLQGSSRIVLIGNQLQYVLSVLRGGGRGEAMSELGGGRGGAMRYRTSIPHGHTAWPHPSV